LGVEPTLRDLLFCALTGRLDEFGVELFFFGTGGDGYRLRLWSLCGGFVGRLVVVEWVEVYDLGRRGVCGF
jgi:hypothetical protein